MPRIIAGRARGTHLAAPAGRSTRPTADRVKEALFSILMSVWPPDSFLDLYAGTGQIGLEAASRGAGQVVCVEQSRAGIKIIEENIARTHLESSVSIIGREAGMAVRRFMKENRRFDIIYADPPYDQAKHVARTLSSLLNELIRPGGLVIFEHDAAVDIRPFVTNLQFTRCCQYGTAMLSFYTGSGYDD